MEFFHKEYLKNGAEKQSLSQLMGDAFKKARLKFPNMRPELVQEAKSILTDYLKSVTGNMPMVKNIEAAFNFNISKDVAIRGYIDRVDIIKDSKYHIVDYKTTKNIKYLDPFQLKIYGLWLKEKVDPNISNFKASYLLLRHQSKLKEYELNDEDIEKTKQELLEYASKIRIDNTWVPIPTILCNWCDFQSMCPAHRTW